MKIELAAIGPEGKALQGELPAGVFELQGDLVHAISPLHYDLFAQLFENELLLRGSLSADFEMLCSRSWHHFTQRVELPNFATSVEVSDQDELALDELLREEILIGLPTHPVCDGEGENSGCQVESRYFALDKTGSEGVKTPLASERDPRWDALEALQDSSSPQDLPSGGPTDSVGSGEEKSTGKSAKKREL